MIWEIDDGARAIEGLDVHGRADPAYAAALGLIPAPTGRRVLATALELCIVLVLALPGVLVATPVALQIASGSADAARMLERGDLVWPIAAIAISNALVTIFTVLQLLLHGRKGLTIGKATFGIRTVNVRTLERPGFWRGAVVRYLVLAASFLIPLLGPLLVVALSPLFDGERRGRGWLDQAGATWLVDIRRGLNPYDVKRMRIARKTLKTPEHSEKAPLPSLATPLNRDAPAEYVPSGRFSGGVIGAHRVTSTPRRDEAAPATPGVASAPPAPAPGFAPVAPAASSGMVDAVPPPLASGQLLDSFASRASAPAQPAPEQPAPAVRAPAAPAPIPAAQAPAAAAAPVTPAPVTPAPVTPAPAPAVPIAPAPAAAQAVASDPTPSGALSAARAVLVLDTGVRVEVRGATLLGRAPAPVTGEGAVQLVPVADDTLSVSKTHLAFLPARRGVLVVDRGSTNGSSILRAGGEIALAPADPTALQTGDVVRFGDRSLTVERV
ncbi:RDD family protein [Microbacterium sp. H1-D42]|uniref:RDD family protein n=1 Tax=Microbacterium sp. H1-D42 TaxID=2925844 RepID=UPI001F53D4FB|nr:RDD family protein [Microbacterium sp. H1-D42]UNK70419.1 RDD family protein [Microbacterium sp. H1-D42]